MILGRTRNGLKPLTNLLRRFWDCRRPDLLSFYAAPAAWNPIFGAVTERVVHGGSAATEGIGGLASEIILISVGLDGRILTLAPFMVDERTH